MVLPVAERQRCLQAFAEDIAHAQRLLQLLRALKHLRPENHARQSIGAEVLLGAGYRHRRAALGEPGIGRGVLHRLAVVFQPIDRQRIPELANAIAQRCALMVAGDVAREAVGIAEALAHDLRLCGGFEGLGLAQRHRNGRAHRIARQQCRERPVQNIDARQIIRPDHRPAWREGVAGAQQVGKQDAVGIQQAARALNLVEVTAGKDGVAIANEAATHHHVRLVFDGVFGGDDVAVGQLVSGDGLHHGRRVAGERRGRGVGAYHGGRKLLGNKLRGLRGIFGGKNGQRCRCA